MPIFERGETKLYYEEQGAGFPLLLIAPGGMRSSVPFWQQTPWNPIEQLAPSYRVIAMDQRNAGQSTAPISAADSWQTYTEDQLALMDHLEVETFHVAGMCIGGPYCMGLIQAAPQRVASAILFQTIGLSDNRQAFFDMFDGWAAELKPGRPEVSDEAWEAFKNKYVQRRLSLQCLQRICLPVPDATPGPPGKRPVSSPGDLPRDCRARPKRNPG